MLTLYEVVETPMEKIQAERRKKNNKPKSPDQQTVDFICTIIINMATLAVLTLLLVKIVYLIKTNF